MSSSADARRGWLVGPLPDLFLGCGLGYVVLVAAVAVLNPDMAALQGWMPLVILVTGVPHYGATLLRAYSTAEARRRYAFHAVHLTALLWALFVAAVYQPALASLLITLYLTWSPWHYAGQNYGLA